MVHGPSFAHFWSRQKLARFSCVRALWCAQPKLSLILVLNSGDVQVPEKNRWDYQIEVSMNRCSINDAELLRTSEHVWNFLQSSFGKNLNLKLKVASRFVSEYVHFFCVYCLFQPLTVLSSQLATCLSRRLELHWQKVTFESWREIQHRIESLNFFWPLFQH